MQTDREPSSQASTWALAVIFGLVGASIETGIGGFLVGAMLGALLAQVLHLRNRARSVELELQRLKRSPQAQPPASPEERAAAMPSRAAPRQPPPQVARAQEHAEEPAAMPPPRTRAQTESDQQTGGATPGAPSAFERATAELIGWLKRGNPLARVGIVILFFGAAFLAKYAADNKLFPVELRFIAIASGAFALLIVGWRLRDKRAVYAQLLQGGGIAGLYLTVFAATKLYQLLPFGLAFALMFVIAVSAAIIAVAQNSLSLAVIGTAGGFLAPILVSTGGGNHVALFSYYALLNLGVFAVAWFRTWRMLNVLGFVFTFTITGLWRASGYESGDLFSADFFLILFFLMYVGVSILNGVRQPPDLKGYVSGSLVFGLPVVAFTLHATLVSRIEYAMARSALALGAFYLLLAWTLFRSRLANFRLLIEAFAALGVIFASLAVPLAFDTRTTAAMWAVEGAGLLWLGVRQQRRLARAFGALLQAGAGLGYLIGLHALREEPAVLNSAYLGALMLGVSGIFSSYWLYRNREHEAGYEAGGQLAFALWGIAWWFFGGLQEIDRFLDAGALGASLVYAAATSGVLAWLGAHRDWRLPLSISLYLPSLAALIAVAHAASLDHPFAEWGAAGWLTLFVAHYAMLRISEPHEAVGVDWLHAGACWMLALLIAWEGSWQVAKRTAGVWASLPWGVAPALLLAWIGRRQPVPEWPLAKRAAVYRMRGGMPIAIAICAWIFAINLTSTGDPAWLPYLPLLNPLDVGVALCFAALALWWTALDEEQRAGLWPFGVRGLITLGAGLVFVWLNSALIRTLHHNWGAPITLHEIADSTFVQSSLSIFWGVLSFIAMTIAARRKWRYAWIAGAGLMIVVVAKLFLVDLSSIGTIARIASFLTVGVLLLITGYLAPLPPRKEGDEVME